MIKIKETTKSEKKINPYYLLKYEYMIGDSNGQTDYKVKLSINNPFIERFVTLINKLKPIKGHWGIIFGEYDFNKFYTEGQLTKEEYDFLRTLMFDSYEDEDEDEDKEVVENTFKIEEKDKDYSYEFFEGVRGETEYSFLVFEGAKLYYYDEYGVKNKTYFENA